MMKYKTLILFLFLLLIPVLGYGATSDALTIVEIGQDMKNEYGSDFSAPFNVSRASERVDEGTGAVEIKETDLHLPGKNGLDFKMIRRFNSQSVGKHYRYCEDGYSSEQASVRYYKYNFIGSDNKVRSLWMNLAKEEDALNNQSFTASWLKCKSNENAYVDDFFYLKPDNTSTVELVIDKETQPVIKRRTTDWAYKCENVSNKKIGYNWNIVCPKMQDYYVHGSDIKLPNSDIKWFETYTGIFEDENGRAYMYSYTCYNDDDTWWVEDSFSSEEYKLYIDNPKTNSTHELGFNYMFRLVHKTGKTYYFSISGKVQAIIDKYGNYMLYTHNSGGSYTVTDTMGRIITVSGTGCTVTDGNKTYTVAYNTSVDYNENDPNNLFTIDDTYMLDVTKSTQVDNITTDSETTKYYMSKIEILPRAYQYMCTQSYNLDKIEYPSNCTVEYDYQEREKYYSYTTPIYNLRESVYLTTERRVYEYDVLKNKTMYSHNMSGIGLPSYERNSNNYKNEHTVTYSDSNMSVHQIFDENDQKKKETKTYDGYKYEEEYTYESQTMHQAGAPLIQINRKYYNGDTANTLNTSYDYDDNYNLLSETEGYTNNVYTYSEDYGVMLTQTYNKNASTTVVVSNTLTTDGKSVACQTVKENGVVKSKTEFEYNEYGDVIKEKRYYSTTAYDTITYSYTYSPSGKTVVKSIGNTTETFVYDMFGNLISHTDGNGYITNYEYDMHNRVIKQINPDGTTKLTQYNTTENYIITTDENGNKMKYQYSPTGNLADVYVMENGAYKLLEHSEYDGFDRQTLYRRYSSANRYADVVYTYDDAGRQTTASFKDNGTAKYSINYGYTYSTVDNYAATTVTATLGGGTVTPVITTQYDYRQLPLSQSVTSGGETVQTLNEYDYLGNLTQSTDQMGNVTTYTYDYAGNNLTVTNAENNTASNEYDLKGRLVKSTDFNGNSKAYTYDIFDRLASENLITSTGNSPLMLYTYDNNGNVIWQFEGVQNYASTTAQFNITGYEYDSRNRPVKMTQYEETGATTKPEITQYYYDNVGNILRMYTGLTAPLTINGFDSVTAGSDSNYSVTKYQYNHLNQLVSQTDALNQTETYTYDYQGNVLTKTDRNGNIVTQTYNWQSQPLTITSNDVTVTYAYDNYGNRTSMVDSTGTTSYTYDKFLRLSGETKGNVTKTYTYDAKNQRTRFVLNMGTTTPIDLLYNWNTVGLLSKLTSGADTVNYTYDANGKPISEQMGNVTTTMSYNASGYLTRVLNKCSNVVKSDFNYNLLANGNVSSFTTAYSDSVSYVTGYTYDGANRLTAEATNNGLIANAYNYDDFGNRREITNQKNYSYDLNNRLLTESGNIGANYNYDNNGNLYSKASWSLTDATGETEEIDVTETSDGYSQYTYDGLNRLTQVTNGSNTYTYEYDGDGHRTAKVVNGTRTDYIWDGDYIVAETTNGVTTAYIRGNKLHFSKTGDTKKYYLYNGHGDVVQLLDSNYNVVTEYMYDAFGNQLTETTDTNPFRYCGEYYDAETGLIYLRNRYYDTSVGRFISENPIRDGLNWYVYCGNNPVSFVDPLGLWAADGSDERFKENNPVVYSSLGDLTQTYENLESLENQGLDIGNMKNEVEDLANKVRYIGDKVYVEGTDLLGESMSNTEAVIYTRDKIKGMMLVVAAGIASIPGKLDTKYANDGTKDNAIKHANWNAIGTILTKDKNYVKDFTDAHEYGYPIVTSSKEHFEHTKMDMYNNNVGRTIGVTASLITKDSRKAMSIAATSILFKANTNGLVVINK